MSTSSSSVNFSAPNLVLHPPRSPRVRIGGFVLFARMLDKGRATLAGTVGDYHFNCPLDQAFLNFVGVDAEAVKELLAAGKGDAEILAWIKDNAKNQRTPWEIQQWSAFMETYAPDLHTDKFAYLQEASGAISKARGDVRGWFDLLDLDDYASYGGKA